VGLLLYCAACHHNYGCSTLYQSLPWSLLPFAVGASREHVVVLDPGVLFFGMIPGLACMRKHTLGQQST
jgi:hypothetical protein